MESTKPLPRIEAVGFLLLVLFCCLVPCPARADDLKALQAMTWLYRINEVDATIRAARDVAAADREMERLEAIAKKDKSSQNVERYNDAKGNYEKLYTARLNNALYRDLEVELGTRDYASLLNAYLSLDKKVTSYGFLSAQHLSLEQQFRRIRKVDLQLCNAEIDQAIATVMSVYKDAKFLRKEGGSWIPMYEGRPLFRLDTVETSTPGRVQIEVRDRVENRNRGPTVINLGPDSLVIMQELEISGVPPNRDGWIDLIRGAVRAHTKNWGERSVFSVRTGTSLCGIRGTDIEVYYDDVNRTAKYLLHHGDAFVTHNAGTTVLPPGHEMEVINGYAGQTRPFQPQ